MQAEGFEASLEDLIAIGREERVAIMCAEGNPFRCHRLLVADALSARKIIVMHIYSKTSAKEHAMTGFAKVVDGSATYPGPDST
jgi:uncharacterized protein (DUF488 family)